MKPFNDKIKIYKFDGLTQLKNTFNYDNYLIVCYDGDEKVWYLMENKILWDSYKEYFKEKLGITDPQELQMLLNKFNNAVKNKSYEILSAIKIKNNKYTSWSTTDKEIKLTTKGFKTRGGYSWEKKKKKVK